MLAILWVSSSCTQDYDSQWRSQQFGSFTFHYHAEEQKLVNYLGRKCKQIEAQTTEDLGLKDLGPIQVRIASTHEDFSAAQPGDKKAKKWTAALAWPAQGKILMKSPKLLLGGQPDYEKIFIHEVAHIALDRALNRMPDKNHLLLNPTRTKRISAPLWLHEGYAIYLADEWSPSREVRLTQAVLRKKIIPLGRLVHTFPNDESRTRLAYAESADLVHYLIHTFGKSAFHQFLSVLAQGHRFGFACRQVFDLDLLELEKKWQKHLRRRYTWIPLLTSTGTLWFLTALIFLAVYIYKKVTTHKKLAEWSTEDPEQ